MQSLNYEILQTKAYFPVDKQEDCHECKSKGSFKIACRPKFKLVLLCTLWIYTELTSKHNYDIAVILNQKFYSTNHMYFSTFSEECNKLRTTFPNLDYPVNFINSLINEFLHNIDNISVLMKQVMAPLISWYHYPLRSEIS